ncbi:hypothetical protein [Nocardia camponoti]|uniref:Uncharacterized protein n=1 Tax=Nocardia camponoti TaxID=1616106 RepID=A0A917QIX7_9NOCA|nr:hypothetical protein [Nocardia camponoti]GGK52577.1 hypothetical protein GCM10011591_25410 [Nocardia camponoti]
MATGVGLRIGANTATAAVVTEDGTTVFVVRDSVLHMSEEGDAALGGKPPLGVHSISGFVAAIGDPAGIDVDGGEPYRAEDLFATALFCLIDLTTAHLNGPAEFYATHPGDWSTEEVRGVREALDYLGLKSIALLGENELPAPALGEDQGRSFAAKAAEAALVAVLATPAGSTPPDPTAPAAPLGDTDVLPSVRTTYVGAQAYSAAIPAARAFPMSFADAQLTPRVPVEAPAASLSAPSATGYVTNQPVSSGFAQTLTPTTVGPPVALPPRSNTPRTPLIVAVAVVFGLLLGGLGVALALRSSTPTLPPTITDAVATVQPTSAPPPVAPPVVETTTETPEPTWVPPVVVPKTTQPPEPTTTEPPEPPAAPAPTTKKPTPTPTPADLFPGGLFGREQTTPKLPAPPALPGAGQSGSSESEPR